MDAQRMGAVRPISSPVTQRFVCQLQAKGHDAGEHTCEKRFAIAQGLNSGGVVVYIDGDSPIFAGQVGGIAYGSPSGQMVGAPDDPRWGKTDGKGITKDVETPSHHAVEWDIFKATRTPSLTAAAQSRDTRGGTDGRRVCGGVACPVRRVRGLGSPAIRGVCIGSRGIAQRRAFAGERADIRHIREGHTWRSIKISTLPARRSW
jgi:hypothetical protein